MSNNERIDAYFRNELNEAEKQDFLQDVDADASLKSDFKFQQNVTDGIKAHRKQELIAKLDSIQIASTGQSLLLKTIGIVGIATVATIGTYMWMNQDSEPSLTEAENTIDEVIDEPAVSKSENTEFVATNDNESSKTADEQAIEVEESNSSSIKRESVTETNNVANEASTDAGVPNIVIPEVEEPSSGESMSVDEDLSAPEAMSTSAVRLSTRNDVEVRVSKKYSFHYQIVDDALVLYGNFNDSPFEVIELKTNKGINSYLYFKDNFYSLRTDSTDIRALDLIKNEELIKELQKRR